VSCYPPALAAALVAALAVGLLPAAVARAEAPELDAFIAQARGADVAVLGEVHDNPQHHANQTEVVRALQPSALVFEMIPQAAEDEVNELRAEGADRAALAAALDWEASGWPDFAYYAEIIEAAPEALVFGGGQSDEEILAAVEDGAAAAFGPDAPAYGLDLPLPPEEQARRAAEMAASHCGTMPEAALPGMVEAQRFRDAALADAALWARTIAGAHAPVVVITGSGHADKRWGVPALISIANPDLSVVSLGQSEPAAPQPAAEAYDAVLLAPAPLRDDPCVAFQSQDG
jgi:uncharacterized iron-regulated protein